MNRPNMTLSTDSDERKEYPIFDGCLSYFPAALALVANTAKKGNDKHNKGEPLHHARGKSGDHANCIVRHMMDVADLKAAIERRKSLNADEHAKVIAYYKSMLMTEAGQLAWRALAFVQELCEQYDGKPLAPAARVEPDPNAGQCIPVKDLNAVAGPECADPLTNRVADHLAARQRHVYTDDLIRDCPRFPNLGDGH